MTALIQIGDKTNIKAEYDHCYFYEENISKRELEVEVKDLAPFYDNIILAFSNTYFSSSFQMKK